MVVVLMSKIHYSLVRCIFGKHDVVWYIVLKYMCLSWKMKRWLDCLVGWDSLSVHRSLCSMSMVVW